MPFNGSGTFTRLFNWTADAGNNLPISATKFDGEDNDFASGFGNCLTRDGQGAPTAPLTWTQPLTINVAADGNDLSVGRTGGANNPQLRVNLADASGATLNLSTAQTLALAIQGANVISVQAAAVTVAQPTTINAALTLSGANSLTVGGTITASTGGSSLKGGVTVTAPASGTAATINGLAAAGSPALDLRQDLTDSTPAALNSYTLSLENANTTAGNFSSIMFRAADTGGALHFGAAITVTAANRASTGADQAFNFYTRTAAGTVNNPMVLGAAGGATINGGSTVGLVVNGASGASLGTLNAGASSSGFIAWQIAASTKGYIGNDGGGIIGTGTGTGFGLRSEADLLLASGAASFLMRYSSTGNLSINAQSSGNAFTISGLAGTQGIVTSAGLGLLSNAAAVAGLIMNSAGSNYGMVQNDAGNLWSLATGASSTANGTVCLQWDANTEVGIATPTTIGTLGGSVTQVGYMEMPLNAQTGASYTLALTDRGKMVEINGASQPNIVIPANASVAFPIGTVIMLTNQCGASVTISITTDTLQWLPSAATGTRTFAFRGVCTLYKASATVWYIWGFSLT